jgi:hypothetical protein
MYEVIGNLRDKIVINEKIILDLKNYIYRKYPDNSSKELSLILADGIHRIINNSMGKFQEILKNEIERNLIMDAVAKSDFSINAYKVFCQYCKLNLENENNISELYEWLCLTQDKPIIRDELVNFIDRVKSYENLSIEDAIGNAAEFVIENKIPNYTSEAEHAITSVSYINSKHSINIFLNTIRKSKHILFEYVIDFVVGIKNTFKPIDRKWVIVTTSIIVALFIMLNAKEIGYALINNLSTFQNKNVTKIIGEEVLVEKISMEVHNGLPEELQYVEVDKNQLRSWLEKKDSMLAEEPYLSTILDTAKQYNVNPLFMIAITGQEQGFVPKTNENALKIANNPFNVYESWVGYNTDIIDSSKIAAQTIIKLSRGKPEEAHAIQWINEKYAEDKNWWVGVDKIFNRLNKEIIR